MIDTFDIVCLAIVGIITLTFLIIDIWGMSRLIKQQLAKRKEK